MGEASTGIKLQWLRSRVASYWLATTYLNSQKPSNVFLPYRRSWRLYALVIDPWLLRIYICVWFLVFGDLGHKDDFTGPFDYVVEFASFVPNLVVVQLLWHARQKQATTPVKWLAVLAVTLASLVVLAGSLVKIRNFWLPRIAASFGGTEFLAAAFLHDMPNMHNTAGKEATIEF